MSKFLTPFQERLFLKLFRAGLTKVSQRDTRVIQRAFVEALKEEVAHRYGKGDGGSSLTVPFGLIDKPLVISGFGSFKMRTRGERIFDNPSSKTDRFDSVRKPPSRRLVFTSKWEPLP